MFLEMRNDSPRNEQNHVYSSPENSESSDSDEDYGSDEGSGVQHRSSSPQHHTESMHGPSFRSSGASRRDQSESTLPILSSVVVQPSSPSSPTNGRRPRPRSSNVTQAPLGLNRPPSTDLLTSLLGRPFAESDNSHSGSSRQTTPTNGRRAAGQSSFSPTSAAMLVEYTARGNSMTIDRPSLDNESYVYVPGNRGVTSPPRDNNGNSSPRSDRINSSNGLENFLDESLLPQSAYHMYDSNGKAYRRNRLPLCRRILRFVAFCIRIFFLLLLPLYIGAVMVLFALDRRAKKTPLFLNERDWVVVVATGALLQLSLLSVMVNAVPEVHDIMVGRLGLTQDYSAPFFIYPFGSLFLCIVAIVYLFHDWRQAKQQRRELAKRQRNQIHAIVERLRDAVKFRPEFILVVAGIVAASGCFGTRFCSLTNNCSEGVTNQLWDPKFMREPLMYLVIFFEFSQFFILTVVLMASCSLYWQNLQLVRVFVSPAKLEDYRQRSASLLGPAARRRKKKKNKKKGSTGGGSGAIGVKNWNDFSKPESLAVWYELYHVIIAGMNNHPAVVAVCAPTFIFTALISVGGTVAVVVDNVYQRHGIATFTTILISVIFLSIITVCTFLYLTVQLDYTVALQSQLICKVQNQLQGQIESLVQGGSRADQLDLNGTISLRTLDAKVNALKALDVFMRHCDANPKLIGLSLESIRWIFIILLLIFVNAFFVLLFMIYCEDAYDEQQMLRYSRTFTHSRTFAYFE